MPRKSRATGVGRGNGTGSRQTQFADGMPSANPKGRPRRPRVRPAATFNELLHQKLLEPVKVTTGYDADGQPIEKTMRHLDAVVSSMLSKLGKAPLREQIGFFRHFHHAGALEANEHRPSGETVAEIVAELAAEAEREGGYFDEQHRPYRADRS